jgi:hypothetical protein
MTNEQKQKLNQLIQGKQREHVLEISGQTGVRVVGIRVVSPSGIIKQEIGFKE